MRWCYWLIGPILLVQLNGCSDGNGPRLDDVSWGSALEYEARELFPVTIGDDGTPRVRVLVNDRELEMVFATSPISALRIATGDGETLDLPVVGTSVERTLDGAEPKEYRTYEIESLRAWNLQLNSVKAYEDTRRGLGSITPHFLVDKRFTLDYRRGVMAVSGRPLPKNVASGEVLALHPLPIQIGTLIIRGTVNGREVLIQLMTGRSGSSVDPGLIKELELPEVTNGYHVNNVSFAGFEFDIPSAKMESFDVPNELLVKIPEEHGAGGHHGHHGGAEEFDLILLGVGSDILSKLLLTVDYRQQKIIIAKNSAQED